MYAAHTLSAIDYRRHSGDWTVGQWARQQHNRFSCAAPILHCRVSRTTIRSLGPLERCSAADSQGYLL